MQNLASQSAHKEISYFTPSSIFVATILFFNVIPGFYIVSTEWKEDLYYKYGFLEYMVGANLYFEMSVLFLGFFVLSKLLFSKGWGRIRETRIIPPRLPDALAQEIYTANLYRYLSIFGIILTALYFFDGGYEKLLSFGSNIDSWTYRLIGYDDRSRFLIAGLEASRRVLLPLSVSYFFVVYRLKSIGKVKAILLAGGFFQILGAIMTLDRAPILLFIVMFLYINMCLGASFFRTLWIMLAVIVVILPIAGIVTFLQYNITTFSIADILETGQNFLIHRTWIVPSVASIELSFVQFPLESTKLGLQFSRLGALFGNQYIGTQDQLSIFVTPVGAIADVWRNLGETGIVCVAIFLGWYFSRLDAFMKRANAVACVVHSFNALSLVFYYIFGLLFSQGILFQMVTTYFILSYETRRSAEVGRKFAIARNHAARSDAFPRHQ